GTDLSGMTFAMWGLAFKPNTDDIREAPALVIIKKLTEMGAKVKAYDPEAMEEAKKLLNDPKLIYCEGAYEAMTGADATVIVTEWNQFRALGIRKMKELMKTPILVDLRNIYEPQEMADSGFQYSSIGRPLERL
ncbi:MAG: UDP binding domain-containing protein, partial [Magnetospiraceae bacterium]